VIGRDQILEFELIEEPILLTNRLPHHRRSPVPETVETKESRLGNALNRVLQQPQPEADSPPRWLSGVNCRHERAPASHLGTGLQWTVGTNAWPGHVRLQPIA
jgi:hypothetical protein